MRIRKTFVPFAASVAWCFMAVAPALLVESSAASFTGSHPRLSVSKSGSGSGIVRSTPAGISCGSVCSARFPLNAAITLTATASSGTLFTGWSGACSGSAAITTLVLAGGARCTASFALGSTPPPPPATQASLWITPAGTGSGLVTSSPAGISCGSTCTASYALNTSVALSASAHAGSTFSGWSGSCAGVSANTQISLAANSTCFATFTSSAYTVNPAAGTNGSIAPATAQTVAAGATTTFTITPGAGFTASVGGSCGGSLAGTTYTTNAVNGSCSVVASFSAIVAAAGVTYFVANGGNNANSCATAQSSGTPRQTIQSALACLAAGDTLVIRDGTYSGAANALANLPNGSAGKYITIRAENEGNAILTAGLQMINSDAYLTFQGLRLQDSLGRSILGNHLKFFRNEFKGGCASGNCAATTVGSNDVSDTADILFEDNWFHGKGGRYNLLVYNANRVVVRRGVIRHDAGWTDTKGDPEAGLNFYNSTGCSAQNVVILDSNLAYQTWQAAFYSVHNSASPNTNANNSWLGIIALNNFSTSAPDGAGLRFDGNDVQTSHIVQNAVLWDNYWGMNVAYASSVGVTASGLTVGQTLRGATGYGIAGGSAGSKSISNAIVTNLNSADLSGVSATYFDTFNNGSTSAGTGRVSYSPFTGGLAYLIRIETGSPLKTAGSGGGQIGAQIVNRIGTAGTLQGESGWNADTGVALWPFPNDARIRKEMCVDAGITRGFCAGTSLTGYIMNYLGNGNPYP